jgi:hypothetical protein
VLAFIVTGGNVLQRVDGVRVTGLFECPSRRWSGCSGRTSRGAIATNSSNRAARIINVISYLTEACNAFAASLTCAASALTAADTVRTPP